MTIVNLTEQTIPFEKIYLDPNNPRFWTEKTNRAIPDKKIPDSNVQTDAFKAIENHGIQELVDSILRNGFLPMDRIVVRPIDEHDDKYVVVEGNRRFCALMLLRKRISEGIIAEDGISEEYLEGLKQETDSLKVLVYQGGDTDISWLLQGVRHISGIREWKPAQRARLVADQIDNERIGLRAAGQRFGLSAQAVGRLYRSYKALEQMRDDEEFRDKARNDYFTLFEEAIRNKHVKGWLGWDEQTKRFTNEDNLQQFYSWICPDDEHVDNARRIHDPRQIKSLGILIEKSETSLLQQVDDHEITIETAKDRSERSAPSTDWRKIIDQAAELIDSISLGAIESDPVAFIQQLGCLYDSIERKRRMAGSIQEE